MTDEEFQKCSKNNDHSWYKNRSFVGADGTVVFYIDNVNYDSLEYDFRMEGTSWTDGIMLVQHIKVCDYYFSPIEKKICEIEENLGKMRETL